MLLSGHLPQSKVSRSPDPASEASIPKCHIQSLPEDIFLQIVLILISDNLKSHSIHRTIMAVCHTWREIVIKNPLCWTHVEIGSGMYPIPDSFLRSGPTQLVTTTLDFRQISASDMSMDDVSAITVKHHRQICALDVVVTDLAQVSSLFEIWKWNGISTPHLKSISVTGIDANPQLRSSTSTAVQSQHDGNWPGSAHVESLTLFSFKFSALPAFKNLKFLDISIASLPNGLLGHIFNSSPLIETLIVHQYEISAVQPFSSPDLIEAPALRFLGVGLSRKSGWDVELDDFYRLLAPNLEGLDIQQGKWCAAGMNGGVRFSPKLQRVRIWGQLYYADRTFLSTLPATVTLEIVEMPTTPAAIDWIFSLSNLEKVVWTFSENEVNQWKDLWNVVRWGNLRPGCPMVMDVPKGADPPSDVLTTLGKTVTVLNSEKWDPWLLGRGGFTYGCSYLGR